MEALGEEAEAYECSKGMRANIRNIRCDPVLRLELEPDGGCVVRRVSKRYDTVRHGAAHGAAQ